MSNVFFENAEPSGNKASIPEQINLPFLQNADEKTKQMRDRIRKFLSGNGQVIYQHMFDGQIDINEYTLLITLQLYKSPDQFLNMRSATNSDSLLSDFLKGRSQKSPYKALAKSIFEKVDLSAYFERYFYTMWFSRLPCFDVQNYTAETNGDTSILKKCFWKAMPIPCSAIFKKVPTDRGMCCAFNKEKADNIFIDSKYTR